MTNRTPSSFVIRDGRPKFGIGRKLNSAELQLLILKLLAEKPRHGYEVIATIEALTNGFYVPSPGMVYPALARLVEFRRAASTPAGTRKLYVISDAGRAYLQERRVAADTMLSHFARVGDWIGRAERALNRDDGGGDFDADKNSRAESEMIRASRQLHLALADRSACSAEEQRRIAAVLNRATAEILGKSTGR